jgi:ribose transport system permease protein
MAVGFYGSAQSAAGTAYELKAIAAAVVGGVSLTGGRGTAIGVLLGALVIQLIESGIIILGIDSNYTNVIIGLAIVAAVVVDQVKLRLAPQSR